MSIISTLPLKIKREIASYSQNAWYLMYRNDTTFADYARTDAGKREFIDLFTITYRKGNMYQCYIEKLSRAWYDFDPGVMISWSVDGTAATGDKVAYIKK